MPCFCSVSASCHTQQLSEGNFVKVFRLAQLLLEYLLYVQENLKYTNGVLDKSR